MDHDHTFSGIGLFLLSSISAVMVNVFPEINMTLAVITKLIPIFSFILFVIINHEKIKEGWNNLFKK